ncbi:MAG: ATP-binding protein [Burkholderiales bacterium]
MRWLLPRSLFGRLVMVLLGGLIVAQLAAAYINLAERDRLLYRAGGMQLAQRIADIARLLDSVAPQERRRIAAVFNAPPLSISLDRPPLALAGDEDAQNSVFAGVLRFALGSEMPVRLMRRSGRFEPPPGSPMMRHPMGGYPMPGMAPGGASYLVQITLRDGALVTFDSYLSPQEGSIPLRLGLTLLVLLGTVIALSLIAVRWVTEPLSALATAAEKLGRDIDRPALEENGPLEVRRAASAFNLMQQRLSRFLADRARVLTAMSHDLKTPLTRLRLRMETVKDPLLRAKIEQDLDEMQSMVTQTLDYMRDSSRGESAQQIDLMALLETLQIDFRDTGSVVEIDGAVAQPYVGRPLALRRCLTNLVENAIRYGGRAMIAVEDTPAQVVVRIVDDGPGMPDEELERAFEPFYRGERSRSRETGGTGLGLGIARNIARAHGGELVLKNRPARGLEAILTLPRQDN